MKLELKYNKEKNAFVLMNTETNEIISLYDICDAKEFFDDDIYAMLLNGVALKIER